MIFWCTGSKRAEVRTGKALELPLVAELSPLPVSLLEYVMDLGESLQKIAR